MENLQKHVLFSSTRRSDINRRPWNFFFCETMGRNIGKNIRKISGGKYSQKLFDNTKQCATDELNFFSKKVTKKEQKVKYLIIDQIFN